MRPTQRVTVAHLENQPEYLRSVSERRFIANQDVLRHTYLVVFAQAYKSKSYRKHTGMGEQSDRSEWVFNEPLLRRV